MSGILLGALAYSGIDNNKINVKNKKNDLYNSNIEDKMNQIEIQQANSPYLKQFDELRFDSISQPSARISGTTGFSEFDNSSMNYNVVTNEHFTHNNMLPSTSRRDVAYSDRSQRKLETFTGISDSYIKKKEKLPLFEPLSNLSWINGMPSITDSMEKRYLPSNKNNYGNLPFQNSVKVRPGIGDQVQEGKYSVYRVDYKNVDDLRPETKKKVTFENKPLETIKKGEVRGPDPYITKTKLPDFREQKFDDLVPSRASIEAPKLTGQYTDITTFRGDKQNYNPGNPVNTNFGVAPNVAMTNYEPSHRQNFNNDNQRAISNINNKPVMTNTKSFTNYETQRATTNTEYEGNVTYSNGLYVKDYNDIAKQTLKETMIDIDSNIGISGPLEKKTYVFSNDMILPVTNKELTIENNYISNITTNNNNTYTNLNDNAKDTIKETTLYEIPEMNIKGMYNNAYTNLTDDAKPTIKQSTILNNHIGGAKSGLYEIGYTRDELDVAKETTKQTTEINKHVLNVKSNIYESGYTRDDDDVARNTIKQLTEHNKYIGQINSSAIETGYVLDSNNIARPTIKQNTIIKTYSGPLTAEINKTISNQAAKNMQIDDSREKIANFNRSANGKADANGPYINRENVKLNEPINYSYVSHPYKMLDGSVMPSPIKPEIPKIVETSNYYINDNFINTLKNNPLVNDIYHPKNV